MRFLLRLTVPVLFLVACTTRNGAKNEAMSWSRRVKGVTAVECVNEFGGCDEDFDCTVYREEGEPIPLVCSSYGCKQNYGRK